MTHQMKRPAPSISFSVDPDYEADVVWFYDEPYLAVEAIRGHVAFCADRVEIAVKRD